MYLLLFVVNLVLAVAALIDCLGGENEPRNLSRVLWALIILLFSPVGAIAWFLVGRPERAEPAGRTERPAAGGGPRERRTRPLAPDDDPEFLDSLKARQLDDDEMFRRWEADLRRREEDLRRKEHDDADGDPPPDAGPSDPPSTDDKR